MRVLIADDMTTHRLVLSMMLKKLGHEFVASLSASFRQRPAHRRSRCGGRYAQEV
jgi:CheY-like chemotaxis protein